jgi:prolyl-tRNA editing enzyme YbaK/EbsC (Cys-tRNA(Pro) deacylase)
MHPSAQKVAQAAHQLGLNITLVEFPTSTRTAADAAASIGCQVAQIVKSLLFLAADQPVMALVSGANQLDERKLAALLEAPRRLVTRADADAVKRITGFTIGGVPPFGHAAPLRVFIDTDLLHFDQVWAAAGTPTAVFAIQPDDLVRASRGVAVDLKKQARDEQG